MNTKDIISSGLLELYVSGNASSEEKILVETYSKQFPEIKEELTNIENALQSYATANAIEPSKDLKDKILNKVFSEPILNPKQSTDKPQTKIIPFNNYWKWVAAASIALLIGSGVLNMFYYKKYDTATKNLNETQIQLAQAQQQSSDIKNEIDWVKNPNSTSVSLKETGAQPGTTAKIFWMQNTQEVMIDASNLPDAPQGMQYQFWAIVDGKPVNGGLIITNDKGIKFRMQKMKSFGRAEAFAISLEKEGGNPTPTKVVSLGKII